MENKLFECSFTGRQKGRQEYAGYLQRVYAPDKEQARLELFLYFDKIITFDCKLISEAD